MASRKRTTTPSTPAVHAGDAPARPEDLQAENSENSEFASETYKTVSGIKEALTDGVKAQGKVSAFLRVASMDELKVLGGLLAGSKCEKERKLLGNLVSQVRKSDGLAAEKDLDKQIISFKADGLKLTKKPDRKQSDDVQTDSEKTPPVPSGAVLITSTESGIDPEIMAQFRELVDVMTLEELTKAANIIAEKLAVSIAAAQENQAQAA